MTERSLTPSSCQCRFSSRRRRPSMRGRPGQGRGRQERRGRPIRRLLRPAAVCLAPPSRRRRRPGQTAPRGRTSRAERVLAAEAEAGEGNRRRHLREERVDVGDGPQDAHDNAKNASSFMQKPSKGKNKNQMFDTIKRVCQYMTGATARRN